MQMTLVLLSWILTAAYPELSVRSLLSPEGIRWFLGNFTENIQTSLLVWLLLCSIAFGAVKESKILHAIKKSVVCGESLPYRQRLALWLVLFEFIVCFSAIFMLAFTPHAILLSATGELFPSSFSRSAVPSAAFCLTLFSVTFATISGTAHTHKDVFNMLTVGLSRSVPLLLIYIPGVQLYYSLLFVFSL